MQSRLSISVCKFLLLCRHPFARSSSILVSNNQYCKSRRHLPSIIITHSNIFQQDCRRSYSVDTDKEVDTINLKFAEAREEIESAMDSKETVYFNEEAECARAAVTEVLEMYDGLLKKLPESEKSKIQRAMGLKIEQLKAELGQLNEYK